jgi:hypothetical protein
MQYFIRQNGVCQVLPRPGRTEDVIYYLIINHYVMIQYLLMTLNDSCSLSACKPNKTLIKYGISDIQTLSR